MTDVDHTVLTIVERLAVDYAGEVATTRVIHAVHATFRDHPDLSATELERMTRNILEASSPGQGSSPT